jgi:hypothetical protein
MLQLTHIAAAVRWLMSEQGKLDKMNMAPAMASEHVLLAALPAVMLWGVYALLTRTSLHSRRSTLANMGILFVGTIGLSLAAYSVLLFFGLAYVVTHAPH